MKSRNLISDSRGAAFTVFVLFLLIPLSILMIVSSAEISQSINVSDETLQKAVTSAAKGSAMMVCPKSQAVGEPLIAHSKAHEEFLNLLTLNLGLTSEGEYVRHTGAESPLYYWFLVYNGETEQEGQEGYEIKPMAIYTNRVPGGYFEAFDSISTNSFGITDNGFAEHADDSNIRVTLDRPGVIAIVQANIGPIFKNEGKSATRWAAAKLVKRGADIEE